VIGEDLESDERHVLTQTRPLTSLTAEADRVVEAIQSTGIAVRLAGGLAIHRRHQAARREPLAREYADLDLAVNSRLTKQKVVDGFLSDLGYRPDEEFNKLHGHQRLYYVDVANRRHVDVFVDAVRMCHSIVFTDRLLRLGDTLTVTDLLLSKLQVVELSRKDLIDILAILHDQAVVPGADDHIDPDYLMHTWKNDWPLWRTCQLTLQKVRELAPTILGDQGTARVRETLDALDYLLQNGQKTRGWKLRARIGDRIRWYELPEEVEG
jgi:hypothetical protein